MKSKINPTILILTLTFLAVGCSDTPFDPGNEKQPPGSAAAFGLVEVTISGIGTQTMSASAKPAPAGVGFALTQPNGSGGSSDGTIQLESLATGSFTRGIRNNGGLRYVYATFKVRNADVDGNAYPNSRQNLTFLAVDNSQTLGVSAVSELKLFDTTLFSGSTAVLFAEATIPTGRITQKADGPFVPVLADVLQTLTEAEIAALSPPAGVEVFPYGFITRSPNTTPGSRMLPANPGANQFDGLVTFAFKLPLRTQANQDPFEISLLFLPVDDSQTRLTQSIEFQQLQGDILVGERAKELGMDYVTIFPGSGYQGMSRLLCDPVRISGTVASPVATLFSPPADVVSLSPDPYASGVDEISLNTVFTATFSAPVNSANANEGQKVGGIAVHGRQSGTQFIGEHYLGGSTPAITSPAADFAPGEQVEISLTPELGICSPKVFHYRTGVTAGNGNFIPSGTFNVGEGPRSIALGDVDGNGDLDILAMNSTSDNDVTNENITLLLGNGTGGFTKALNSPLRVTNTLGARLTAMKLGDLNNDGVLDMVATTGFENRANVLLGDGDGGFYAAKAFPVGQNPRSLTLGDVNADGAMDAITANFDSDDVSVLLGDGLGGFQTAGTFSVGDGPNSVALGDVNQDGFLDIVTSIENTDDVSLLLGAGNGSFGSTTPFNVGDQPTTVALGDLNNDGALDIVTGNFASSDMSILTGDGLGGFGAAVSVGPVSAVVDITIGDMNSDGNLDIVTGNNATGTDINVLLGDGLGNFSITDFDTSFLSPSVAVGDVDSDSDLDIVVAKVSAQPNQGNIVQVLEGQQ